MYIFVKNTLPIRFVFIDGLILCLALTVCGPARAELPFSVGEKTRYDATWNGIPVVRSETSTEWVDVGGRRLVKISSRTDASTLLDWVYPACELVETLVDPQTMLPVRLEKRMKEDGGESDEVTVFDHAAGTASYTNRVKGIGKTLPIASDTRDLFSYIYFLRGQILTNGMELTTRIVADGEMQEMTLNIGETERIDLPHYAHKPEAVRIRTTADLNGFFIRKGRGEFWFSTDPRRVIIMAKVKIPFSSVKFRLREVVGGDADFWTGKPPGDL